MIAAETRRTRDLPVKSDRLKFGLASCRKDAKDTGDAVPARPAPKVAFILGPGMRLRVGVVIVASRTPLILVAGRGGPTEQTAHALLRPGTIVVRHDLADIYEGVVRRTLTTTDDERETILELAHGCVSCTLRKDLLPLLRRLHERSTVDRIVLLLDPLIEPEALCWAIEHHVVAGIVGRLDAPAATTCRSRPPSPASMPRPGSTTPPGTTNSTTTAPPHRWWSARWSSPTPSSSAPEPMDGTRPDYTPYSRASPRMRR